MPGEMSMLFFFVAQHIKSCVFCTGLEIITTELGDRNKLMCAIKPIALVVSVVTRRGGQHH